MKTANIEVGKFYELKTGRHVSKVKVKRYNKDQASWTCLTASGNELHVRDSNRFLRLASAKNAARGVCQTSAKDSNHKQNNATSATVPHKRGAKPKGCMSGLEAAAKVVREHRQPLNVKQITKFAVEKGYWTPRGKTPSATIAAAILREIDSKGTDARFRKAQRGLFTKN